MPLTHPRQNTTRSTRRDAKALQEKIAKKQEGGGNDGGGGGGKKDPKKEKNPYQVFIK